METVNRSKIICKCGTLLFDGIVLKKVTVMQFGRDAFNAKCKDCKAWLNGISIKILTGEVEAELDFRKSKGGQEVFAQVETKSQF